MAYTTGKDLKELALSRGDELGIGNAEYESEVETYLNTKYIRLLANGFPWPFGRKTPPGVFTTSAEIIDRTATVSADSPTVTLSSVVTPSLATSKFFIDAEPTIYRVSAHTAGTAAVTLDSPYIGTTVGAGLACHLFQDEVALPTDFLAWFGRRAIRDMSGRFPIEVIGQDELNGLAAYPGRSGSYPRYGALIGDKRAKLTPWPTTQRRYELDYLYRPTPLDFTGVAATDTPIITPPEHRVVLVWSAVAQVLVDKEDTRAQIFGGMADGLEKDMRVLALKQMRVRQWTGRGAALSARR